ncbi:hypothetical protein ACRS8P_12185 [Burkholderia cenocepacia]
MPSGLSLRVMATSGPRGNGSSHGIGCRRCSARDTFDAPMLDGIDWATSRSLSAHFQQDILDLAAAGDLHDANQPHWPAFERSQGRLTMRFGDPTEAVSGDRDGAL